jgi:ATP-dependent Lon protease
VASSDNEPTEAPPRPAVRVERSDATPGAIAVQERLPDKVCVFPLRRSVPFPNLMMPVLLENTRAREIVARAESMNEHLLLVAQRDGSVEQPKQEDLFEVGVLAKILRTLKLPDGNASAMCQGLRRARVVKFVREQPMLLAQVAEIVDVPASGRRAQALFRKLQSTLRRVIEVSQGYGEEFGTAVLNIEQPEQLADFTGSYFLKDHAQRQRILETADVTRRLELALEFLLGELELAELGNEIQSEIQRKVEKAQKEYFLREQMKIIRRELGEETDARQAEVARVERAIADAGLPAAAAKRAQEELTKLKTTPVESAEYSVVRNYLDWLVSLPWQKLTVDNPSLQHASQVLAEDHWGLEEVKDRIVEFLAVRKLKPEQAGTILCLAGPPGVGKTSLGRSIARALGRKFWRFSLGGMRDEAEIKGHRRTYVGAMPGRILQGIRTCGTSNPVLMLDEIDKLGADYRGDPAAALLEVLDPEQNHAFLDHYLDVPFDLSRVMFVATANVLPQIPAPLLDRMEVIEIPGYLTAEKVQIALRHILPRQLERHGLKPSQVSLAGTVVREIVEQWTREAGVRNLEKMLVRICRKSALAVATRRRPPGKVKVADLHGLLGPARFADEGERRIRAAGVVAGLAWTPHGGDVMYIEVAEMPGKGQLVQTGNVGTVMSESCRIAMSYLRSQAERFGIAPERLERSDFHVHFPAGAIPKDGPSAGITIATALASQLLGRMAPSRVGMTGELTLVGEVLPIGGVREKVLAAARYKLRRVVLPAENRRDVEELRPELRRGLEFEYVETFDEVFERVFGKPPARRRRPRG